MKKIETITISGIEDFIQEMVPTLGFQRIPVYRGHANVDWKILPSLFREEVASTEFKSWAELEAAFMISLKQRGSGEIGFKPDSELEWMSVGQHAGLPTRFSAWSENALAALYFATEETAANEDGAVWRILPGEASFTISHDYEQVPEEARLYRPQNTTPAMLNQKTCYLSHPLPQEDASAESFEELFELGSERLSLAKLIIPAEEKSHLRRRLATMGVDSRTLFPGMTGLCQQIRSEIFSHTDSYEWVFPE
jgi:hypothetical protein